MDAYSEAQHPALLQNPGHLLQVFWEVGPEEVAGVGDYQVEETVLIGHVRDVAYAELQTTLVYES